VSASLSFNGTSDYARLASAVIATHPVTLACWANVTSIAASITTLGVTSSADQSRQSIGITATTGAAHIQTDSGASAAVGVSATGVTINTWQHLCGACSAANSRIAYRNGVAGTTETTSRTPASLSRTSIGVRDTNTQANWVPGLVAHAAIWNVALTAEEILALAKGWNPTRIRRSALVFYVPLMGGIARDRASGTSLTLTGTSASADGPPCMLP
jgi:hypothetical protein